jgi:IBR domain, a half RING-finger domain
MSDVSLDSERHQPDIDDATRQLIYRLLIEDVDDVAHNDTGRIREEHIPDNKLTSQRDKEGYVARINRLLDQPLSPGIAQAAVPRADKLVVDDKPKKLAFIDHEIVGLTKGNKSLAIIDHTASKLNTRLCDETRAKSVLSKSAIIKSNITSVNHGNNDDGLIAKCNPLDVSGAESTDQNLSVHSYERKDQAGPSSYHGFRSSHIERQVCTSCYESIASSDIVCVPCGHEYCRDCLQQIFLRSINDEALFPPKCCRIPIPLGPLRSFIDADVAKAYEQTKVEYETPNRTYCFSSKCSAFVPADAIKDDIAECQECKCRTCTICKQAEHFGPCLDQCGDRQVLQLAEKLEWQSCAQCWTVVELADGCHHIMLLAPTASRESLRYVLTASRCRCGAEFCYVCGKTWKICRCEFWPLAPDEEHYHKYRLLTKETQQQQPPPSKFAARSSIAAAANLVLAQEMCDHREWSRIEGSSSWICEDCYNERPGHIYECTQCCLMVCVRCMRRRLRALL